ncbi:related to Calpain-like protease palB RIM13 [Lecanosticta acicola]|uniref:Related to Calpain-like protease palB RIM13 n=1 Tax=Lecanosticta acicola TaxID=111012 RepID=A0AAI8YWZ2_9PEZI|nr:related to Calpain-like protease palB RIM13 [Lecanosticta acicola]
MSLPSKHLEELRQDAERLADQLLRSSSRDEALQIAIQAVETSMKALRLVSDPSEKAKYTARAQVLMREAEEIKKSTDWRRIIPQSSIVRSAAPRPSVIAKPLKEPVNSRELPKREQIIKLKAGWLNGVKFPEWSGPPDASEFQLKDGENLFVDESSELPLSDFQAEVLDGWKRPIDALPPPLWFPGDRTNVGPVMHTHRDVDLVQDAATDCSVVASLCAGLARAQRGHTSILSSTLYPYDFENRRPQISKNGKYIVRLNFNGCFRKVVIDDRIPTTSTTRVIHVVDRNTPGLLWPALLEKAYLKVRGGYDFPGSNSATDLWILSGWIPEQVFLQSDEMEPDRFWKRILNGFSYGDVLITLGTGKMSSKTERAIGLAGEHDYAVLDVREVEGQRLLLIKNPWVEGTSWRGRFKSAPKASKSNSNQDDLLIQLDDEEPVGSPRDLLNVNDQLTPGTFWMDLDNVLQHFESIYLNWNPGLFAHRQDIHFAWNLSVAEGSVKRNCGTHASFRHNPQYTISTSKKEPVWLLLWRHFRNSVPQDALPEDMEGGRQFIDLNGHITLIVFSSKGRRVLLSERHLQKGWFVDSPQTILQLEDCEPGEVYTVVPLEQGLPADEHHFTISAFSSSPIRLSEAAPRHEYATEIAGSWTKETAGGNAQQPTYCDNPQFAMTVPHKSSISLLLETSNQQLNVHVKLLHSNGKRMFRVHRKDIIVDSKEYRPNCCLAEYEELDAGQYTIICSTFEPAQLGHFTLRGESSQPVSVSQLPREGAGRIRYELSAAAFKSGESKIAAPMLPKRLVNLYAIARHADAQRSNGVVSRRSNHSHIRLSIEFGRGPQRRIPIASNGGEYSDSAGAVRTEPIDLSQEHYRRYGYRDCWIVLDRMYVSSESQDERFSVELFVDQPDAIEVGVWRAWED